MSYAQVLHLLLGKSTSVVWESTSVVSGYSSSRVSVSPASKIFTIEVEFECNTILVQAIPSIQSFTTLASLFFFPLSLSLVLYLSVSYVLVFHLLLLSIIPINQLPLSIYSRYHPIYYNKKLLKRVNDAL